MVYKLTAPAKVNLFLHVTGKSDKYHLLESIMISVDICDVIEVKNSDALSLHINGKFADSLLIDQDTNIIYKAAKKLQEYTGLNNLGADITLTKNIPIASGVGGGSSDAAATLKLLNQLWNLSLSDQQLAEIGLSCGADVPFCLHQKPAFVTGIGENITAINIKSLPMILVNPLKEASTAQIFKMGFDRFTTPLTMPSDIQNPEILIQFLKEQKNDLQKNAITILPEIQKIIDIIGRENGCIFSRMSGSGATCFGVFTDKKSANLAYKNITKNYKDWWCNEAEVIL